MLGIHLARLLLAWRWGGGGGAGPLLGLVGGSLGQLGTALGRSGGGLGVLGGSLGWRERGFTVGGLVGFALLLPGLGHIS